MLIDCLFVCLFVSSLSFFLFCICASVLPSSSVSFLECVSCRRGCKVYVFTVYYRDILFYRYFLSKLLGSYLKPVAALPFLDFTFFSSFL